MLLLPELEASSHCKKKLRRGSDNSAIQQKPFLIHKQFKVKHYLGNVRLDDFVERSKSGWACLELLTSAELGISRLLSLRYEITPLEISPSKNLSLSDYN